MQLTFLDAGFRILTMAVGVPLRAQALRYPRLNCTIRERHVLAAFAF